MKQNIKSAYDSAIMHVKIHRLTDQIFIRLKNIQKYNNFNITVRYTKSNRLDQHDLVQIKLCNSCKLDIDCVLISLLQCEHHSCT